MKRLTEGFRGAKRSEDDEIHKLFSNVLSVHPPKVIVFGMLCAMMNHQRQFVSFIILYITEGSDTC